MKGFRFEGDGVKSGALLVARDMRGFRLLGEDTRASLEIVIPNVALDEWLRSWADDESAAWRKIRLTRLTDGSQYSVRASLERYGPGVATVLAAKRIADNTAAPLRVPSDEAPPTTRRPSARKLPESGTQRAAKPGRRARSA